MHNGCGHKGNGCGLKRHMVAVASVMCYPGGVGSSCLAPVATASSSGDRRGRFLSVASAAVFTALVYALVSRPAPPDYRMMAHWALMDARCQSIAHREVFGTREEAAAASRELEQLLGVTGVTRNKSNN